MAEPGTIEIPLALMDGESSRISFGNFIALLRRLNPIALYEKQLIDYYRQEIVNHPRNEESLLEEYAKDLKVAQTKFEMGFPISALPLYAKIANIYGESIKGAYTDYADALEAQIGTLKRGVGTREGRQSLQDAVDRGVLTEQEAFLNNPFYAEYTQKIQTAAGKQQEAQQKTEQAQIEQLKANVYGQRGRVALQQAVGQGLITPEDAYENNPYWQDYTQSEYLGGQEKEATAAEVRRQRIAKMSNTPEGRRQLLIEGLITPEQAYPSEEQTLADKAARLQAVNPGMSMDEARKVADVRTPNIMAEAQASQVMEPYRRWLAIAKQEGIDTSRYETNLPTGNLVEQIARVVSDTREGRKARQSALLAKQYPEGFRQYTQEFHKGFAGGAPLPGWEKGFQGWATATPQGTPGTDEYVALTPAQEAFQGSVRAQEEANLRKYGNIYQAYKTGFLGKLTDPNEYKPLEQWIQETPEAKVAWEEQERIRALSGPRPGRPIYARRR